MNECNLCPNNCNIDRDIYKGFCGIDNTLKIAKYYLHTFEEPVISGEKGSGTIFFCGCSLKCVFCQNYEVSRNLTGKVITTLELSKIFKELEDMQAENINLVSPTHFIPQIIEALKIYKPKIPVIYNSSGYENIESLKLIDEYIDIYLPDLKYFSPIISKRYSLKEDYFEKASKTIEFMSKKPLIFKDGLIKSGLIVRHLILPLCTDDSVKILEWFSKFKDTAFLSLMSQYTPFGDIANFKELQRKITNREYQKVVNKVFDLNIENCYLQKLSSSDQKFIPKWDF